MAYGPFSISTFQLPLAGPGRRPDGPLDGRDICAVGAYAAQAAWIQGIRGGGQDGRQALAPAEAMTRVL